MSSNAAGKSIGGLRVFCLLASVVLAFSVTSALGADVTSLLQQSRASAAQLKRDAEEMETFTRSKLTWESHAHQLEMIKGHINKSGQILSQLHDARSDASHSQQTAIDRIEPLLQEMASNTTTIINHLNRYQGRTWTPDYQSLVKENFQLATELSDAISDFVEYAATKNRIESLEQKLNF